MSRTEAPLLSVADAAGRALAALDGGEPVALVTVVSGPEARCLGRHLAVTSGSIDGTSGSSELDARAVALARASLAGGPQGLREVELGDSLWELYVELQRAPPELVIVGAGHIAQPLSSIGAMIGFRVTIMDDRPEYASRERFPEADRVLVVDFADPFRDLYIGPHIYLVLVTRAHRYDYECIRKLLRMEAQPAYLGMIGSRRRVRAVFEALVGDGIDPEKLTAVRAPVGLDIGAETPEEIAVAVAAEMISVRRGGGGAPLTEQEHVLARVARKHGLGKAGDETSGKRALRRGEVT